MRTCLAWYKQEQWDRWRAISADRDGMQIAYADWLTKAEEAIEEFTRNRVVVHKVVIDVEDFQRWVCDKSSTITGVERSAFANECFSKNWIRPDRIEKEKIDPKQVKELMRKMQGLDLSEIWEPFLRRPKSAVCPIFSADSDGLEQIGSGVLLEVGDARFLLSAAHVTERRQTNPLFVPSNESFINIFGQFLETPLPKSGSRRDDAIDVGCVRLDQKVVANIHSSFQFLDAADCDSHDVTSPADMYTVIGYPARKSRKNGVEYSSETFSLSGDGVMDFRFDRLRRSPSRHLLVQHRFKRARNFSTMQQNSPPHPEGMSGGGMFAWVKDLCDLQSLAQPKLAAVLTEYHQSYNVFVGTRLAVYLGIIKRSDPSLPIYMT